MPSAIAKRATFPAGSSPRLGGTGPVLADSAKGDARKIAELRRSVRAHDDTLVLYNFRWFRSDPDWVGMIDSLAENIERAA